MREGWRTFPGGVMARGGVTLDAMYMSPFGQSAEALSAPKGKPRVWALFFLGNGSRFELESTDMQEFARRFQCMVVGVNYRGVGLSEGVPWCFQDLVDDGKAAFEAIRKLL